METYNGLPFASENTYEEDMKNTVEPYLAAHGGRSNFESWDGHTIGFEQYLTDKPAASVVISHGFTESAEKFREMSYYFLNMGYNVFAIDHRGHGRSFRYNGDPNTVCIKYFDEYIDDLHTFVNKVVKPASPDLPLYLYSHSMGGAVAVQYLQEHPGVFAKAVLSAPMISPRTAGMPHAVTDVLTKGFILFGQAKKPVIGSKGFNPLRTYENSHDTSKARFDYYHAKRCADMSLQTADPSNRWVSEAIRVTKLNLDPARCKKITCPVLLCQPETDTSVYSEAEDEFIALVPDGKLVQFKNCKHEIYMSVDETMKAYLETIRAFYQS